MSAENTRFLIRPSAESTFTLEVAKTGLMAGKKHSFFFEQYQGELDYDPQNPENSKIQLTVEAGSITCKDPWLKDKSMRKKVVDTAVNDMMSANQHPQLKFSSSRLTASSKGQFEVQGDLTVRGITRPITFTTAAKQSGERRLEIDGDAEISLKDYGLKPPSAMLGLVGTKSKMILRFLVWAEKASA